MRKEEGRETEVMPSETQEAPVTRVGRAYPEPRGTKMKPKRKRKPPVFKTQHGDITNVHTQVKSAFDRFAQKHGLPSGKWKEAGGGIFERHGWE